MFSILILIIIIPSGTYFSIDLHANHLLVVEHRVLTVKSDDDDDVSVVRNMHFDHLGSLYYYLLLLLLLLSTRRIEGMNELRYGHLPVHHHQYVCRGYW